MDLRVLKAFLTICRLGNITRASEVLYISQPALTRQIQELEEEVGCKLFIRGKRQITLTENGYLFQIRAKEILDIADRTKKEISEGSEFLNGLIPIGCVESSVMDLVADQIKWFDDKYPHVLFELYSADGDDLKARLDSNSLDMAVLLEPVEAAKYRKIPLPSFERWGVAATEKLVPLDKKELSYKELCKLPLILPRRYIVIDDILNWFGVTKDELNVTAYHNLPSNALRLVSKNIGVLLCVEGSFTNRGMPSVRFIPIKPIRRSGHVLVRKKNRALGKASELFWKEMQEKFGEQAKH